MEVNPVNIFFVKSDSKGDRLLFRYPYTVEAKDEGKQKKCGRHNPYAISTTEDLLQNTQTQTSNICKGQLSGFTDEMLSTLFAVKPELCNRKFELKVNDVRFVGHPTLLPYRTNKDDTAAMILINIVFALQASASHSIVKCYYDLSKRLGKALRHEEKRCSYLTEEMKIMLAAHDEVSTLDNEINTENDDDEENSRYSVSSTTFSLDAVLDTGPKSAFHLILQRSSLARSMKQVFEELSSTGIVQVRINKWVLLSFCLPHKAHQIHNRGLIVEPETIDKCLQKLRPYHGILLMVNPNELLECIPLDGSPALLRLIKLYSPLKSLQTIAIEADLTLTQVFQLTGHLVYWAKATVIYPLCEGNVYVVAPGADTRAHSPLPREFAAEFPGLCLLQILSSFSLPAPLWYHARGAGGGADVTRLPRAVAWLYCILSSFSLPAPLWYHARGAGGGADVTRLPRAVAWLLRRRLLLQLHTYVQFNSAHWARDPDGKEYFCEKHNIIYNQSCNVSFSSLNQMQLNVPEPVDQRNSSNIFPDSDEEYPTQNNLNQTDFSHTKPIVIESEVSLKHDKFEEVDSANHSFDDGLDVVDGIMKTSLHIEGIDREKKLQGNSVDSGISNNINGNTNGESNGVECDNDSKEDKPKLKTRLSDLSLKESETSSKDTTSDEDRFESDPELSPRQKVSNGVSFTNGHEKKNGISLNLKLQSEMSFQPPTVWTGLGSCDAMEPRAPPDAAGEEAALHAFTKEERAVLAQLPAAQQPEDLMLLAQLHKKDRKWCSRGTVCNGGYIARCEEEALHAFTKEERAVLAQLPAAQQPEDLMLLAQLHKKGYLRGEHHLEEIMFMENVTRSQLMQLLDKFKDVLITFETEDPAVAMLYPYQ